MNYAVARSKLWVVCEKHERMRAFYNMINQIVDTPTAEQFWSEFWGIWSSSENLHADMAIVQSLYEYGTMLGSAHLGLDEDDSAFIATLPDTVTIYRGCSEQNKYGWSWSLDKEKALWFAKRSVGYEVRYLLKAKVSRHDILGYLSGRNESELIIHPTHLKKVTEVRKIREEHKGHAHLIYAVHSGSGVLESPEMNKARAQMMVGSMELDRIEHTLEYVNNTIADMKWFAVDSKMGYFVELKNALEARLVERIEL
jgi:hypothetical protein